MAELTREEIATGKTDKSSYQGKLIGEVIRSEHESRRIYLREFNGHPFIEIRQWIKGEQKGKPYERAGKGTTFRPEEATEIAALVVKAFQEYEGMNTEWERTDVYDSTLELSE